MGALSMRRRPRGNVSRRPPRGLAEPSAGVREELLADRGRGLVAELLPQPDFRPNHEKPHVNVVPQVVDDELRRRSRPLQLIGQESAEQDLFGAIRVGVRHREPFFYGQRRRRVGGV